MMIKLTGLLIFAVCPPIRMPGVFRTAAALVTLASIEVRVAADANLPLTAEDVMPAAVTERLDYELRGFIRRRLILEVLSEPEAAGSETRFRASVLPFRGGPPEYTFDSVSNDLEWRTHRRKFDGGDLDKLDSLVAQSGSGTVLRTRMLYDRREHRFEDKGALKVAGRTVDPLRLIHDLRSRLRSGADEGTARVVDPKGRFSTRFSWEKKSAVRFGVGKVTGTYAGVGLDRVEGVFESVDPVLSRIRRVRLFLTRDGSRTPVRIEFDVRGRPDFSLVLRAATASGDFPGRSRTKK